MKTLEQLGISPTPWKVCDERSLGGAIIGMECAEKFADLVAGDVILKEADATIMSAAPELYDALQSLVEYIDRECIPCGETACELMAAAHNALAKAAGESEARQ